MKIILYPLLISVVIISCTTSTQETENATEGPAILEQIQAPVVRNYTKNFYGQVNNAALEMRLVNTNGNLTGSYSTGAIKDKDLDGKLSGDSIKLFERNQKRKKTHEIAAAINNGMMLGTWTDLSSGSAVAFSLQEKN